MLTSILLFVALYLLAVLFIGFNTLRKNPGALDPSTLLFWVALFVTAPFAAFSPFVVLVAYIGRQAERLNEWLLRVVLRLSLRWAMK